MDYRKLIVFLLVTLLFSVTAEYFCSMYKSTDDTPSGMYKQEKCAVDPTVCNPYCKDFSLDLCDEEPRRQEMYHSILLSLDAIDEFTGSLCSDPDQ